jgi:hypothetical protein
LIFTSSWRYQPKQTYLSSRPLSLIHCALSLMKAGVVFGGYNVGFCAYP